VTIQGLIRGPWAPALLTALAVTWLFVGDRVAPRELPPPDDLGPTSPVYTDEARAFLGGLETGDEVEGGWLVADIFGPERGRIAIVLELEGTRMEVSLFEEGAPQANALLTAGGCDFHFALEPDARPPPEGAIQSALEGISERLEEGAEIPPGM